MAQHFEMPHKALKRICDALGLSGPIQRVVIDASVKAMTKVYVQYVPESAPLEAAAAALADTPVVVRAAAEIHIDKEGNVEARR